MVKRNLYLGGDCNIFVHLKVGFEIILVIFLFVLSGILFLDLVPMVSHKPPSYSRPRYKILFQSGNRGICRLFEFITNGNVAFWTGINCRD